MAVTHAFVQSTHLLAAHTPMSSDWLADRGMSVSRKMILLYNNTGLVSSFFKACPNSTAVYTNTL